MLLEGTASAEGPRGFVGEQNEDKKGPPGQQSHQASEIQDEHCQPTRSSSPWQDLTAPQRQPWTSQRPPSARLTSGTPPPAPHPSGRAPGNGLPHPRPPLERRVRARLPVDFVCRLSQLWQQRRSSRGAARGARRRKGIGSGCPEAAPALGRTDPAAPPAAHSAPEVAAATRIHTGRQG